MFLIASADLSESTLVEKTAHVHNFKNVLIQLLVLINLTMMIWACGLSPLIFMVNSGYPSHCYTVIYGGGVPTF